MITSAAPLVLIIATLIGLGATGDLLSWSPVVIALQVAAVALNVWARTAFGAGTFRVGAAPGASSIMRNGPYRFLRHPMYSAVLLFLWAGIASHLGIITGAIGVALTAMTVARVVAEERLLREEFPDYADYARTTTALVPFVW